MELTIPILKHTDRMMIVEMDETNIAHILTVKFVEHNGMRRWMRDTPRPGTNPIKRYTPVLVTYFE